MFKQLYRFFNPKFQNAFLDYSVDLRPRYGHGLGPHSGLYQLINHYRSSYEELIAIVLDKKRVLWKLEQTISSDFKFTWRNEYFPALDTIILYCLLQKIKPNLYIEIGSGISTIIANQARLDAHLNMSISSVDPKPRKDVHNIVDHSIRRPLESVDLSLFGQLEANDVLFVDNSHRILPNSDATVFFLEILPALKSGVIVHIHDIYLPFDYPKFMCDRFYSEQYGLAIALISNPTKFEIISPNYFISQDEDLAKLLNPIWENSDMKEAERHGGSFWFRIV